MQVDLEQFDEILSTARSVRRKLDFERPVERQVLFDCIDVAVQAPTGLGGENWRFVVVDEPSPKTALARLYSEVLLEIMAARNLPMKPTHQALIDRMHEIPAMIFVCVDGEPLDDGVSSQVGFYGSILPAAWSLMLALRARGIGTTWTSLLSARQQEVRDVLNMPSETLQTVMLPVAYTKGANLKRADRLPAQSVTYFNGWGNLQGES
ncbi:MAG: nitroreductase family protein [Pseudomonadota bacterium]